MTLTNFPLKVATLSDAQTLLESYDNFLLDCDGVIWLGEQLIPGVGATLNYLQSIGKNFVFVTNNSAKSRDNYVEKFKKLGFNIAKERIYPTSYSVAVNARDTYKIPWGSKIWVLGDHGIEYELKEMGYVVLGGSDERLDEAFNENHPLLTVDPEVRAVAVGSTKKFNYMRIASTLQYLLDKNIPFIGANIDRTYPGPRGLILPAGGSLVQYMKYTANRDFLDVGKPSGKFLDAIVEQNGFDRKRTLMIGDTLYTDIKFGNDGKLGGGAGSLLVLTGGTKEDDLKLVVENGGEKDGLVPSYYMESFGDLIKLISQE